MNIPNQLTAGDSLQWRDDALVLNGRRYDSAGFALSYALRGPTQLTLQAQADGAGWMTVLTRAQSMTLAVGTYWWAALASSATERATLGAGQLQVLQDVSTLTADGYDGRTLAEKALADAEAALADLAGSGKRVKRYAIGDRNAEYYTAEELLVAINYWRLRVTNEQTAKGIANGTGNPRNLFVRFR